MNATNKIIYNNSEFSDHILSFKGRILFEPKNKTKKHDNQSSWKRIAMIMIDGDACDYYSWFIQKRYSIELNKPLRGSHISIINDSINDMLNGLKCSIDEAEVIWNSVKNKYNNKEIEFLLDLDVRSSGEHWWLNIIDDDYKKDIYNIRTELGLNPKPYYGLHMSIGYANNKNIDQSKYIIECIRKYGNDYN